MEKKNKTANVAKTKERRISNKKVESLHKYWEVFPGLKEKLIVPVEGENYSLIKPKIVSKAVRATASVKRKKEYFSDVTFGIGEMLISSLSLNTIDNYPDILKNFIMREAQRISMDIPFVKWSDIHDVIDSYWPLAQEYHKTYKDGGFMAIMKHPLFISAVKLTVANEIEKERSLTLYGINAYVDLRLEKGKYVSFSDFDNKVCSFLKELCLSHEKEWKISDETLTTEVNRRIENLNVDEAKKYVFLAFFDEIREHMEVLFDCSINRLVYTIDKLIS